MKEVRVPFVDLYAQYLNIKDEIDNAISTVIKETGFIGGKHVSSFEKSFANYQNTKHCISCANGTDSIEILLQAMGIGSGDEVIVPAHTWISTSEAVSNVGATPVFVDTHSAYYSMLPDHVEKKINAKTKAIIPVHLYGLPAPMREICAIAKSHGLKIIEDCAQAHGASIENQKVGTFGDAASFSFYPGKNLGAYGDAGGITTNNDQIAEKARMISNHGQQGKHNHLIEGRNSRLDGIQAAILNVKIKFLNQWNEQRFIAAQKYNQRIADSNIKVVTPSIPEGYKHVFHLYVIQVPQRATISQYLDQHGIQTAVHYPLPLPVANCYKNKSNLNEFPNSISYQQNILSLPIFPEITDDQIDYVVEKLKAALQSF